jgi:titin
VTPAAVPGPARIGTATAGDGSATVNWRPPTSNGGSPVTGYVVSVFAGAGTQVLSTVTAGANATSAPVPGLANGTAYRFSVAAVNAAGTGPASSRSNSVTPRAAAGAPEIGTATPGRRSATVTWTAPAANGGSAITGYVVRVFAGDSTQAQRSVTVGRSATRATISNLVNGTSYRFSVAAVNAVGTGAASALSNSVTPSTVPAAPRLAGVTAGDGSATVTWTAPANTGGAPITGYVVSVLGRTGGQVLSTVTVAGTATSTAVPGLTNGTAYRFSVAAVNAAGTGPGSARSSRVTPSA